MSLLKRIEQGQGRPADQPNSAGAAPTPAGAGSGSGESGGGLSSLQARRGGGPRTTPQAGTYFDLKSRVQKKLLSELDPSMDISKTEEVRSTIIELFEQLLNEEKIVFFR